LSSFHLYDLQGNSAVPAFSSETVYILTVQIRKTSKAVNEKHLWTVQLWVLLEKLY